MLWRPLCSGRWLGSDWSCYRAVARHPQCLSHVSERLTDITIRMIHAIPSLAVVPLFIIWFGVGELSKVLLIAFAPEPAAFMGQADDQIMRLPESVKRAGDAAIPGLDLVYIRPEFGGETGPAIGIVRVNAAAVSGNPGTARRSLAAPAEHAAID